jgi:hypothetical protein
MRKKLLLAGIAALFLATGRAHASEQLTFHCGKHTIEVYGHHGYEFYRGERHLPGRLFRLTNANDLYFRGRKCKFVRIQ